MSTTMPCSNTAALDKYEADELRRSYIDDACERNQQIAERRAARKAELVGDEALINALIAVLIEVDSHVERLLDIEQENEDFDDE